MVYWLVGGADIISIFSNAEMLDEIILSILLFLVKVFLFFRNLDSYKLDSFLKMVKSIPCENGLIQLHYKLNHIHGYC